MDVLQRNQSEGTQFVEPCRANRRDGLDEMKIGLGIAGAAPARGENGESEQRIEAFFTEGEDVGMLNNMESNVVAVEIREGVGVENPPLKTAVVHPQDGRSRARLGPCRESLGNPHRDARLLS